MDDHRSGKIVIQLTGRINKTGCISPRYNVKLNELEKWVTKLLPSRQFGHIVLTTSAGIMDHEEARRKHVAGKIIGLSVAPPHDADCVLMTRAAFTKWPRLVRGSYGYNKSLVLHVVGARRYGFCIFCSNRALFRSCWSAFWGRSIGFYC